MVDLLDRLSAFLDAEAGHDHVWGRRDSMLLVADWMAAATGKDPAAPWRGRYRTPRGALRIIRAAGGKDALLADGFARVGCARAIAVEDAVSGDVGLVAVMTARGRVEPVGAIRSGDCWVVRGSRGLLGGAAQAFSAWRPVVAEGVIHG